MQADRMIALDKINVIFRMSDTLPGYRLMLHDHNISSRLKAYQLASNKTVLIARSCT